MRIATGTDRIELYTESYAKEYPDNREVAIHPFINSRKGSSKVWPWAECRS